MAATNIAIIGGGPGGLTLARLLQKNQIPCTVYEGEPARHTRNQGGSLDLHRQGGQQALAEAGLTPEFLRIARPEAEIMKILAPSGEFLWDETVTGNWRTAEMSDRPEVDRTALRDLLLDSLDPTSIKWGFRVARAERVADGTYTVHFTDGSAATGIDLLVGADGAFSKIRPLVTSEEPHYSGITMIELWKHDVDTTNPWLADKIGPGSCFMFDEGRALLSQRQSGGTTRAYAGVRQPLSWTKECGIDWTDPASARCALVEGPFASCGPDVHRMILESDDEMVVRHLWMLPVGHTWASQAGVTVLGDAAHVMTPFAGVGVNTAMADALDLARKVIARKAGIVTKGAESAKEIAEAVREYEASMFVRAEAMTSRTYRGLVHHFSANGGPEWAERWRKDYETAKAQGLVKASTSKS